MHSNQANYGPGCAGQAGAWGIPGAVAAGSLHTDPDLLRMMRDAGPGGVVQCNRDEYELLKASALNKPPELDSIRGQLMSLCEDAHNAMARTRSVADRLFGPVPEKTGNDITPPVGEGPAITAIRSYLIELGKLIAQTKEQLSRLETL